MNRFRWVLLALVVLVGGGALVYNARANALPPALAAGQVRLQLSRGSCTPTPIERVTDDLQAYLVSVHSGGRARISFRRPGGVYETDQPTEVRTGDVITVYGEQVRITHIFYSRLGRHDAVDLEVLTRGGSGATPSVTSSPAVSGRSLSSALRKVNTDDSEPKLACG